MPYQISRDGQSYGPYTLDDLRRYVASGNVLASDLATGESLAGPTPVSALLSTPPPPGMANDLPPAAWHTEATLATPQAETRTGEYPFFPVSPLKFAVMFLCTFSFYQLYWIWKQWRRLEPTETWLTFVRAFFGSLTNFSLFSTIKTRADYDEVPAGWNPVVLAIAALLLNACGYLKHGFALFGLFAFLAYLPIVATIEKLNARVAGTVAEPSNTKFSGLNIAGIVLGGLFLLLALLGFAMQMLGVVKS